ncbi:MAG: glucosaminidase domain-containing protein [Candidatus Eiseniibacteriota bacterium]
MMAHAHVERQDRPLAFFVAGFLGVLAVVYAGCIAEARISPAAISPGAGQNTIAVVTRTISDARSMVRAFDEIGYTLDEVRNGGRVPRVLVTKLPADLDSIQAVDRRKAAFAQALLPLILIVDETIAGQRRELVRLRDLKAAGLPLTPRQDVWLTELAKQYGVADRDIDKLMVKVDVIPPSLALAQAIEESGWGTSYFARNGNALFGQRAWGDAAKGLAPNVQQADGNAFKVKSFPWMLDAVRAYVQNLNSHPAYAELRKVRAQIRAKGETPDGYRLAGALTSYSERGADYINTIRYLMKENDLGAFDRAKLNAPELVNLIDHVKSSQPTS